MSEPPGEPIVGLRDIWNVLMETRDAVIQMNEKVNGIESLETRVGALEQRQGSWEAKYAKIVGVAVGAATVSGVAVTVVGWVVGGS